MNPNSPWINNMLNDPSNQMAGSSSNPANNPGSSSNPYNQSPYFPTFPTNPYMNPEEQMLFSQWKMQQYQHQQLNQGGASQPNSDHASFHLRDKDVDDDEYEDEDEDEEEVIPTPTSKKTKTKTKTKTNGKTKKTTKTQATQGGTRPRNVWTQDEELLLAECFIQISEDPKKGAGQSRDTFWYRVLDVYNMEAEKHKWTICTKNMLTGKWTPMNKEVTKWNSLVNETSVMSGESEKDFMARVHCLYKTATGSDFKHMSAWGFLKDKNKWKNPESTLARQNRLRVTEEEPEHFGPDTLPRPDGMHQISKSQRSSNSTASSGSNPAMFQEMMQQQIELYRKAKMDVIKRESLARVTLYESQKIVREMRVTSKMDPIDAAIIKAQKARIQAKYPTDEY